MSGFVVAVVGMFCLRAAWRLGQLSARLSALEARKGDLTQTLGDRAAKVVSWYDNEWNFSCRMVDLITYMAERL